MNTLPRDIANGQPCVWSYPLGAVRRGSFRLNGQIIRAGLIAQRYSHMVS